MYIELILSTFAVYRIARMVALETGPFEVFTKLRSAVYHWQHNSWVHEGLNCPLCLSFWLALVPGIVFGQGDWFLWWLGIAGASAALYKVTQ